MIVKEGAKTETNIRSAASQTRRQPDSTTNRSSESRSAGVEQTPATRSTPTWQVLHGDCLDRMRELPDNSIDSVITDPPYGLSEQPDIAEVARCWLAGKPYQHKSRGYMGQEWDSFVPGPEYWEEAMRVLKPGGHLLAFSAPRCYDVLVLALRFAGFEIRDSVVAWVYGQGMPKSLDVSKHLAQKLGEDAPEVHQWQGWGTGLKPAQEPVVVARKPASEKSTPANMLKHGVGAINIDGTRIGGDGQDELGRWPANFMLVHTPDCQQLDTDNHWRCASSCPVSDLDSQARVGGFGGKDGVSQYFHAPKAELPIEAVLRHDASASHYCPKPSVAERDAGLDAVSAGCGNRRRVKTTNKALRGREKAFAPRDTTTRLNPHTTVKPAGIMLWLAKLVTPHGGVILDPFCGSGSTGVAVGLANADPAHAPGWSFIGIEADFDNVGFVGVARDRIRHAAAGSMTEALDDGFAATSLAAYSTAGEATAGAGTVPTRHVSPFRYAGGKGPLLPQTRAWLACQSGRLHLVEGFAGGASVGLTALVEGSIRRLTLVELDPEVVHTWRVVLSPAGPSLARALLAVPTVAEARRVLAGPPPADEIARALRLLLLNRLRRNGILAPGAGLISPNRPRKDERYNPAGLAQRIELLARHRRQVEVVEGDALEVLPAYSNAKDTVFYLDPPYSAPGGPANRLYRHWTLDHERFFEVASSLRGDVLISHQDHALTRSLGTAHGFRLATVGIPTSNGRRRELLMARNLQWVLTGLAVPVTVLPTTVPGRLSVVEPERDANLSPHAVRSLPRLEGVLELAA